MITIIIVITIAKVNDMKNVASFFSISITAYVVFIFWKLICIVFITLCSFINLWVFYSLESEPSGVRHDLAHSRAKNRWIMWWGCRGEGGFMNGDSFDCDYRFLNLEMTSGWRSSVAPPPHHPTNPQTPLFTTRFSHSTVSSSLSKLSHDSKIPPTPKKYQNSQIWELFCQVREKTNNPKLIIVFPFWPYFSFEA